MSKVIEYMILAIIPFIILNGLLLFLGALEVSVLKPVLTLANLQTQIWKIIEGMSLYVDTYEYSTCPFLPPFLWSFRLGTITGVRLRYLNEFHGIYAT